MFKKKALKVLHNNFFKAVCKVMILLKTFEVFILQATLSLIPEQARLGFFPVVWRALQNDSWQNAACDFLENNSVSH